MASAINAEELSSNSDFDSFPCQLINKDFKILYIQETLMAYLDTIGRCSIHVYRFIVGAK